VSDFSQESKERVRTLLLAARRSRADRRVGERHADDEAVRGALVALAAGRGTVAGYVPLRTEPGGAALPDALAAVCDRLLVPVVLPDRDLDWEAHGDGKSLGVRAIAEAELVIVPALAVDRSGMRLGRGGGSYDRALTRVPSGSLIVAALYRDEFVDALPFEPHDLRVGAVVTPVGVTRL
jgi:5-formyltetrahydrofolate cyclo-ligase